MKKILALVLCTLMLISTGVCAFAEGGEYDSFTGTTIDAIKEKGKIVMATEAGYAPFEFLDENLQFAGCDIWLAQQVAAAMGVELEIMDMAFDGIIAAVKAGQVDFSFAGFTVTPERALEIDFTEIYQRDEQMLVVKAGNEDTYATKESLAGLQVGAQRGTVQSILIQNALPECVLFELDKYATLALEVANGNIAGLVVDGAVGDGLIANNGNLVQSNFAFDPAEANFGKAGVLAKGTEDLKALIDAVIVKAVEDGSFQAAYDEAVEKSQSMGI